MKCAQARDLVALEPDGLLSQKEVARLRDHLRYCDDCRSYSLTLYRMLAEVASDASSSVLAPHMSPKFGDRLHIALTHEAVHKSTMPVGMADHLLASLRRHTDCGALRVARAGALLFVLFALSALLTLCALRAPTYGTYDPHLGHLAAFSARTAPDGRVYAALTQRNSRSHCDLEPRGKP